MNYTVNLLIVLKQNSLWGTDNRWMVHFLGFEIRYFPSTRCVVCLYPGLNATTGQFLNRVQLVSSQSLPYPKLVVILRQKESSLLNYLLIADERRDRFMSFQRVLVWREKLTTLSRFSIWFTESISCDINLYTMHAFIKNNKSIHAYIWQMLEFT